MKSELIKWICPISFAFVVFSALPVSATTELELGPVKALRISAKISAADCEANFKELSGMSLCRVTAWTPRDTDITLATMDSVVIKRDLGNETTFDARLIVNINGFYMMSFEQKNHYGLGAPVPLEVAKAYMHELISQVPGGEVYWKIYRVSEARNE